MEEYKCETPEIVQKKRELQLWIDVREQLHKELVETRSVIEVLREELRPRLGEQDVCKSIEKARSHAGAKGTARRGQMGGTSPGTTNRVDGRDDVEIPKGRLPYGHTPAGERII